MAFHIRTVIQSGIFSEAEDKAFTDAIGNYAHIDNTRFPDYFGRFLAYSNCYFRGSIEALTQCPYSRAQAATPMHVFNWLHFARYIPAEIFVNHDWQVVFGRDLPTSIPLFVRSATGNKQLAGDAITFDNKTEIFCAQFTYDAIIKKYANDLLIISTPKRLQQEQRYVVYKNRILTGSEYIDKDGKVPTKYSPISDLSIANGLLQDTMLHRIKELQNQPYTLDIAFVDGTPKILEINSFWQAGLYHCDIGKVISTLEADGYFE